MKTFKQLLETMNATLQNDSRIKDEGFYSAVHLDTNSHDILSKFCIDNFGVDLPDDVHCTVMYSTKSIDKQDGINYSKPVYQAYVDHFEFWPGHDKAGYLVLKLVSSDLQDEHMRLKRCGCKPTFDNYSPHITIITPIDKSLADLNVKIGNTKLQDKLVLQFSNQTVDILKL